MTLPLDIPILFIIFNRPEQTALSFAAIRNAKPLHLYVAADGPRSGHPSDAENCAKCRELVQAIDWDCKVQYLFRENNLGCKAAVAGGISWFFEQVEMGIILEDDCIPDSDFFNFSRELLIKYASDSRIMHIGGTNFQQQSRMDQQSYYFSHIAHVWGWATWKRAWQYYDAAIPNYSSEQLRQIFHQLNFPVSSFSYWDEALTAVQENRLDTWDYQWTYTIWNQQALCITPELNMICNIGFTPTATHTVLTESPYANMPTFPIGTIRHPKTISADRAHDAKIFQQWFENKTGLKKIISKIRKRFSS